MNIVSRIGSSYKVQQARKTAATMGWSSIAIFRRLWLPVIVRRRAEVHIHFGCGAIADPRFVNVDARAMRHVHLVTRSPMLRSFRPASADSLYACHVFEHFSFHKQEAVLRRWYEVLKPGGTIVLSVPDFDKLVDRYLQADREPLVMQASLMGAQDYPGNFHFAIFTRAHLVRLLQRCGFVDIVDWHPRDRVAWPRDHSWSDTVSLNLSATKP